MDDRLRIYRWRWWDWAYVAFMFAIPAVLGIATVGGGSDKLVYAVVFLLGLAALNSLLQRFRPHYGVLDARVVALAWLVGFAALVPVTIALVAWATELGTFLWFLIGVLWGVDFLFAVIDYRHLKRAHSAGVREAPRTWLP